jgi:hypothetical protein
MSANTSHVDENQQFSIIGVVGNLGTADVGGTAPTLPIGVNTYGAVYTAPTDTTGNQVSPATSTAQTDGSAKTQIVEKPPTDATQTNPSLVLTYNGDGNLSTITKVINSISYVKTLSYTAGVLTSVSVWV